MAEEKSKKTVFQDRKDLLEYIVERMQDDTLPPWRSGMKIAGGHYNIETNKPYRGVNRLRLSIVSMKAGYDDPRWMTFKQAKEAGYKVKKGSTGVPIEFWKPAYMLDGVFISDKRAKEIMEKDPELAMQLERKLARPGRSTVFNASQIEGIEPLIREDMPTFEKVKDIEHIMLNSESPIYYDGAGRNFYMPASDEIHITDRRLWKNKEHLYSTVLHEIAHSTGHSSRLNRNLKGGFGSESYAIEELRAELASVILSEKYNLSFDQKALDNSAAYVKSWKEAISRDENILFSAYKDAENIVQYIETRMLAKELTVDKQAVLEELMKEGITAEMEAEALSRVHTPVKATEPVDPHDGEESVSERVVQKTVPTDQSADTVKSVKRETIKGSFTVNKAEKIRNPLTGKAFYGKSAQILAEAMKAHGYTDPHFVTGQQAAKLGCDIPTTDKGIEVIGRKNGKDFSYKVYNVSEIQSFYDKVKENAASISPKEIEGSITNPLSGAVFYGESVQILENVMKERGYTDPRFVTEKQAANAGYEIVDKVNGIELSRESHGKTFSYKVYNVADVKGFPKEQAVPDVGLPVGNVKNMYLTGLPDSGSSEQYTEFYQDRKSGMVYGLPTQHKEAFAVVKEASYLGTYGSKNDVSFDVFNEAVQKAYQANKQGKSLDEINQIVRDVTGKSATEFEIKQSVKTVSTPEELASWMRIEMKSPDLQEVANSLVSRNKITVEQAHGILRCFDQPQEAIIKMQVQARENTRMMKRRGARY